MSETNPECEGCGITAEDMPYEDLGIPRDEVAEIMFVHSDGGRICVGCAE